jgi:hypothetical protein
MARERAAVALSRSHVLIDQDRIPIRVESDEAGRSRGRLVCLLLQLHPLGSQLALQLTDVGERGQLLGWFPFFRISQFRDASPAKTLKPNFS